jgi:hypothetical protein
VYRAPTSGVAIYHEVPPTGDALSMKDCFASDLDLAAYPMVVVRKMGSCHSCLPRGKATR